MMSRLQSSLTRLITSLLSAATILSFLVACGSGGATTTTSGTVAPVSGATEVPAVGATASLEETAASTPGETVAVQPTGVPDISCTSSQKQLVWMVRNGPVENPWESNVVRPAFAKAHPEICLKILSINQDDIAVKREAMIASGEQLDVWSPNWGGNGFANDRARGLIADLTPLIQRDNFDTSVFNQDILKIYQSEGKTWGLPLLTTGSYIYYNMKLFDAAKEPYPTVDWDDTSWTWDKFIETAKKLTKNIDNINVAQYGASVGPINDNLESPPMLWGHFIWPDDAYTTGYAASGITVTDDASIKAYQAFHDTVYKDKVAPDSASVQALSQLGGTFQSGRVAMLMDGGWGHWTYKGLIDDPNGFCWGAAPLPMGSPDAKVRTIIFTDPWSITSKLKPEEQDMAWTFVKFLMSPEQAAAYTQATGTPPTQTALLADYYKQFEKCMKVDDMKKVFEGAFSHGRESSNHLMVRWDEINQIWTNNMSQIDNDPNADIKTILTTIEQQTNEALARIAAEKGQ